MNVQVLFFGATADITGTRSRRVDLLSVTRAKSIFDQILLEYPQLSNHKLHLAINQEFATGEEVLSDGDELAIFTAVSGG